MKVLEYMVEETPYTIPGNPSTIPGNPSTIPGNPSTHFLEERMEVLSRLRNVFELRNIVSIQLAPQ
eukprot:6379843-Pyramimonas_sp.AAC.1